MNSLSNLYGFDNPIIRASGEASVGMLAVVNMILLLLGIQMRLRRKKRGRISEARLALAKNPIKGAQES